MQRCQTHGDRVTPMRNDSKVHALTRFLAALIVVAVGIGSLPLCSMPCCAIGMTKGIAATSTHCSAGTCDKATTAMSSSPPAVAIDVALLQHPDAAASVATRADLRTRRDTSRPDERRRHVASNSVAVYLRTCTLLI